MMQQDEKKLTTDSEYPTKEDLYGPNSDAIRSSDRISIYAPNAVSIDESEFQKWEQLKSADLPNLKEIGDDAFRDSGLESINAPNARFMCNGAFAGCKQLKSADFPNLEVIGDDAFGDSDLKSINVPNARAIGYRTFQNCKQLKSWDFPNLEEMGDDAFRDSGLESINAPKARFISKRGFAGCKQLKTANFRDLEVIGDAAFQDSNLESIHAPMVKRIGKSAFQDCKQLKSADFPNLEIIRAGAFFGSTLESINAPEVTRIEGGAFFGCTKLKSAYFPKCEELMNFMHCTCLYRVFAPKVKSINKFCFADTNNVKDLIISQDLIDEHNPKSDEAWWKRIGINPQTTKISSVEIWANEQSIETRDIDSLMILYRLKHEPEYRPSWPEIGRTCPNMPFHLLVKHCPEDKRSSLPTLSKKIQDTTQPKNKKELLQSYTEQLRIEPKTVRDKEETRIFDEDFNALMKTFTLKDVAKILYAATKEIDKTPKDHSGPGKNASG